MADWTMLAGNGLGNDIGVGADGTIWLVGVQHVGVAADFGIFKFTGSGWSSVEGGAVRIAVGPDGQPWVVNSEGQSFRRTSNRWQKLPGALGRDIAVGAKGAAYMVGTNPAGPKDFGLWKWSGSAWSPISGQGLRVSVGADDAPHVVDSNGLVSYLQGGSWKPLPGASGTDVGTSAAGRVWLIDKAQAREGGQLIRRWTGTNWATVGGAGVQVAAGPDGSPYVVNTEHRIFRGAFPT